MYIFMLLLIPSLNFENKTIAKEEIIKTDKKNLSSKKNKVQMDTFTKLPSHLSLIRVLLVSRALVFRLLALLG